MKKTILITGSTDGIGKLAATKLAKDGHEVYLHGRNATKLTKVIEEIKSLSGNESVNGFLADFSDLNAVKNMATQVNQELPKLDVLINNAGVWNSKNSHNNDGWDIRYVVNYFAPYLLTKRLLPLLQKGNDSRIINLSSAAQDPVNYDVMAGTVNQPERATYGQSKLALTMWSFDIAKKQNEISVIPVNPGSLLNTNMVKEAFGQFWSSADKGGNILYDLAVSNEYTGVTAKYFDNDKGEVKGTFSMAHPDAYDQQKVEKLIGTTEEILGTYLN